MSVHYVRVRLHDDVATTPWNDEDQGVAVLLTSRDTCSHGDTVCPDCRESWLADHEINPYHSVQAIPDPLPELTI